MIGLDTNVLIRLFVDEPDGRQTAAARALFRETAETTLRISLIVLVESVWTLRSRFAVGRTGIATFLAHLLDHPRFDLEARDCVEAAFEAFATQRADFADCLIEALNVRAGASATFTFDRAAAAARNHFRLVPA
ncbi:PIN domain-containing protein [Segnochrobactrum spirostomi]|uniref:Ribonuclease VapC n=1 Tax=Segnochrobactrum spirostomi TaxID=2608987 RepID=A0A6A7Y055_9HYPH|nr:type II toxin-antitoxin system VapC family toxin [Segnochrobactrum spirostomi]MQT12450.1 type II toxin-antitoxin system VapC family toxin [Segnochrobactrum spirostomi]